MGSQQKVLLGFFADKRKNETFASFGHFDFSHKLSSS